MISGESFTHESAIELIKKVSYTVGLLVRKFRRDRWFFLDSSKREEELLHIKKKVVGLKSLAFFAAPGLQCSISVKWNRPGNKWPIIDLLFLKYPKAMPGELEKLRNIPTLVDPLREDYKTDWEWRVAWKACEADYEKKYGRDRERFHELRNYENQLKISVGLYHAKPKKGQRKRPDMINIFRRYLQEKLSKGKESKFPNQLLVEPSKKAAERQSVAPMKDIEFGLLLYLLQHKMIDLTDEVRGFALQWLKSIKFRGLDEVDKGHLLYHLIYHWCLPEDWRTLRKYIALTIRGLLKQEIQMSKGKLKKSEPEITYVGDISSFEVKRKKPGNKGLEMSETIGEPQEQNPREALIGYQESRLGKNREAARKFVYRCLKKGQTLKEIASQLLNMHEGIDANSDDEY